MVFVLRLAALGLQGFERVDRVPRKVVVSVSARSDLVAVKLLRWKIALTFDSIKITGTLPHLITGPVLSRPVISQVLQK